MAHAWAWCLNTHLLLDVEICPQLLPDVDLLVTSPFMAMRCKQCGVPLVLAVHLTDMVVLL